MLSFINQKDPKDLMVRITDDRKGAGLKERKRSKDATLYNWQWSKVGRVNVGNDVNVLSGDEVPLVVSIHDNELAVEN